MNVGPKPQIELFLTNRVPHELRVTSGPYRFDIPEAVKWAVNEIAEKWHATRQQVITYFLLDAVARHGGVPSPWLKPVERPTTRQIVDAQLRAKGIEPMGRVLPPADTAPTSAAAPILPGDPLDFL